MTLARFDNFFFFFSGVQFVVVRLARKATFFLLSPFSALPLPVYIYMCFFFLLTNLQYFLHNLQNAVVNTRGRRHDALVVGQGPTDAEIEPLAVNVGDLTARLPHDQIPGGVIPDLLLVGGLDGQTQVNVAGAARDGAVLGLAVHADAGLRDAQLPRDDGLVVVSRVSGLDRLAKGSAGEVRHGPHADVAALGGQATRGEGTAVGALVLHGREEHAPGAPPGAIGLAGGGLAGGGLVGPDVGGEAGRVVDGKVGTGQDADAHLAVHQEAQADGVLAAAEEALCAVDGVDGPDAARGAAGAAAEVDQVEHEARVPDGPAERLLGRLVVEMRVPDEVPDGVAQARVLPQPRGLLLSDDGVPGEVVPESGNDERLGAEVAHGDGGLVVLVHRSLVDLVVEDALGEHGGALDRKLGDLQLARVRWACDHPGGSPGGRGGGGGGGGQCRELV